jgi:hypothetical protein
VHHYSQLRGRPRSGSVVGSRKPKSPEWHTAPGPIPGQRGRPEEKPDQRRSHGSLACSAMRSTCDAPTIRLQRRAL